MADEKEKTVLDPTVGADGGQPILCTDTSITDQAQDCNDKFSEENLEKMLQKMRRMNDPANLPTVTMRELYENVYQSRPPVIDGLLHSGTCQRQCNFVVFRRTGIVKKWRIIMYSL